MRSFTALEEEFFRAGQQEINPKASRPVHGPNDDDRRSVVPASRVNGDAHRLLLE